MPALVEHLDRHGIVRLHLNCVFYGNNGHARRPEGSVLRNDSRRSRSVDRHTKHLSRASCFEPHRLQRAVLPFWHGLTDPCWDGYRRLNALGDDVQPLLASFPTAVWRYLADEDRSAAIIETAYVAHLVLKSEDDFLIRVARGTAGNFNGQVKWQLHQEAGEAAAILDAMNAVSDTFLSEAAGRAAGAAA